MIIVDRGADKKSLELSDIHLGCLRNEEWNGIRLLIR